MRRTGPAAANDNLERMSSVTEKRTITADEPEQPRVYEPHRIGLPPLRPYLSELWSRRHFAVELARANLRSQQFNTVLGQLWLVLNPLFLAFVFYLLVNIVRDGDRGSGFFAHLMLGLFTYRLVSVSVKQGARSVVGGGRLILNAAFPRALLPISSVLTAFIRFLPMLAIYAVVHVATGLPISLELLWALPIIALALVLSLGGAMLSATAQVYFRDLANILPYFLRISLYLAPVLYYADDVPERLQPFLALNPLYGLLGSLSEAVNQGTTPSAGLLGLAVAWPLTIFFAGTFIFLAKEREFAVRL